MVREQDDGVDLERQRLACLSKRGPEPAPVLTISEQWPPPLRDHGEKVSGFVEFPSQVARHGGMILTRGADVKVTRATGGFLFANPLAPRLLRLLRQEDGASNGDAPYLAISEKLEIRG